MTPVSEKKKISEDEEGEDAAHDYDDIRLRITNYELRITNYEL